MQPQRGTWTPAYTSVEQQSGHDCGDRGSTATEGSDDLLDLSKPPYLDDSCIHARTKLRSRMKKFHAIPTHSWTP